MAAEADEVAEGLRTEQEHPVRRASFRLFSAHQPGEETKCGVARLVGRV